MSFYKMVDDRVELAHRLEAVIEDNVEVTARSLADSLASLSDAYSAEEWYQDESLRQRLLVRWIVKLRQSLVAAANAHRSEERRLEALRRRREEARVALYTELVEIRRQARGVFGKRASVILGIDGRTRRKADALTRQAQIVLHSLTEPMTDPQMFTGLKVNLEVLVETLAPLVSVLETANKAVVHGTVATRTTLRAKKQSMKDFDRHFGRIGRFVICTYELIGRDDLAALVPPRVARKNRRKSTTTAKPRADIEERRSPARPSRLAKVVDLSRWIQRLKSFGLDSSGQGSKIS